MPLPVLDIANALKEASNVKAVTDIVALMEELIHRNQNPTSKFKDSVSGMASGTGQLSFLV
jgi:hypothetical protein